ncbi:hypothetical protein B296_00017481 [Ensete ventricosum]|uniref:Uncharacterized protein n=1 Tax=Ensete ventricosum TaxID=4639 RepID=A0A427ADS9_ENSVE|nr:hypothetical protein B296_00017481 [Ensete ventricosum]
MAHEAADCATSVAHGGAARKYRLPLVADLLTASACSWLLLHAAAIAASCLWQTHERPSLDALLARPVQCTAWTVSSIVATTALCAHVAQCSATVGRSGST